MITLLPFCGEADDLSEGMEPLARRSIPCTATICVFVRRLAGALLRCRSLAVGWHSGAVGPCRARLRLHPQTVPQADCMQSETPATPSHRIPPDLPKTANCARARYRFWRGSGLRHSRFGRDSCLQLLSIFPATTANHLASRARPKVFRIPVSGFSEELRPWRDYRSQGK